MLARLWKPSATIQRIQAGEGTTREDYMDLVKYEDDDTDHCKCVKLLWALLLDVSDLGVARVLVKLSLSATTWFECLSFKMEVLG